LLPALKEALLQVSSASAAGALAKLGVRNVWIRGAMPIAGRGVRTVGEAFTLRFLPTREDLVGPALAALPSSRAAVEAMEAGCIAVIETGLEKVATCQPLVVSPVKVTVASRVPVELHRLPVWVPVFCGPL